MKFSIRHYSGIFDMGTIIPLVAALIVFLLYVFFGLNITDVMPTIVLMRFLAVCGIVEVLFIILRIAEFIYGARVIVEEDHLDVKMLLRRRRLYYAEIQDAKYGHYEVIRNNRGRKERSDSLLYKIFADDEKKEVRAELTFFLASGKKFRLNDNATNYVWKQKKWITDPDLDPDEDVKLYQAYKCYLHACRQFLTRQ